MLQSLGNFTISTLDFNCIINVMVIVFFRHFLSELLQLEKVISEKNGVTYLAGVEQFQGVSKVHDHMNRRSKYGYLILPFEI